MFAAVPFCKPVACLRGLLVSRSLSLCGPVQLGQWKAKGTGARPEVQLIWSSQLNLTKVQSMGGLFRLLTCREPVTTLRYQQISGLDMFNMTVFRV